MTRKPTSGSVYSLLLLLVLILVACTENKNPTLSIITDATYGSSVEHGLSAIYSNLEKQNIPYEIVSSIAKAQGETILVTGFSEGSGAAAKLLQDNNHQFPDVPEALAVWKAEVSQKPLWVINGFDDRGLMYGLLDVAERITWAGNGQLPLSELEAITEKPDVSTRAISVYTMNQAYWESRFYDEDYWVHYMDMLAKNRFNSMVVIFGYENVGFLAPCYPYFFNVDGFSQIGMEGMSAGEQQRNLSALNRMIEMAHERGLDFKVAIWDHIYRGGSNSGNTLTDKFPEFWATEIIPEVSSV